MTNISQYMDNMENVYKKDFRAKMPELDCVSVSENVEDPKGGYIAAFRHPEPPMKTFTKFTAKIRKLVPSIQYDSKNAHTTIAVYKQKRLTDFQVNKGILLQLKNACEEIEVELLRKVRICFKEWLFNETSVIVAGQPTPAFWEVSTSLRERGKARGLELDQMVKPWGAHITAARYLEESDKVRELKELMGTGPTLGESKPIAVLVGHYTCSGSGFRLYPYSIRNILA